MELEARKGRSCPVACFLLQLLLAARGNQVSSEGFEEREANEIAAEWGFSSGLRFLDIVGDNATLESVLLDRKQQAPVVAILGKEKPQRNPVGNAGAFLDTSDLRYNEASLLGLSALNSGMRVFEAAVGRSLHHFRIIPVDMQSRRGKGPFALWAVSNGSIYMDQLLLSRSAEYFSNKGNLLSKFAEALPHLMQQFVSRSTANATLEVQWHRLATSVAPAALAAAVASQIPVWFCIACPIVLGLLAPFVFNLGFGGAAGIICQHYQLPSQECNDLYYGAFAVAMVLSLGSAIPIVYICQLPKCGRQLLLKA